MVHLLVKKLNNLCVVVTVFPGMESEQMVVIPSKHGPLPVIFEEGAPDHLPMIGAAQRLQQDAMPDMKLEVVKFSNREHHSWIPEQGSEDATGS